MANWGEQTRLVFRLAVGLYLIYLAYQVISAQLFFPVSQRLCQAALDQFAGVRS